MLVNQFALCLAKEMKASLGIMQENNAWLLHLLHLPAVKTDLSRMQCLMDIVFMALLVNRSTNLVSTGMVPA